MSYKEFGTLNIKCSESNHFIHIELECHIVNNTKFKCSTLQQSKFKQVQNQLGFQLFINLLGLYHSLICDSLIFIRVEFWAGGGITEWRKKTDTAQYCDNYKHVASYQARLT